MTKDNSINLSERVPKLSRNELNSNSTRTWRESLASRVGIAKEKGDWRKQHPPKRPHEYRTRFFTVNKHLAIGMLAATLTSCPGIVTPSITENMEQAIIYGVITTLVVRDETATGCLLKGRWERAAHSYYYYNFFSFSFTLLYSRMMMCS